ncbi:MAG TPA: NAD-glutamate dehydrogenase [Pelomicrobium sp.]|nr:NAD-glutamate dehydrogenase [Pelomicrobium sp.]
MNRRESTFQFDALDEILALVRSRLPAPQVEQVESFVRQFFRLLDPADLRDRPVEDLYGAAVAHWQFCRHRPGNDPVVRVYNPRVDEHGWQSPHTVVEIANRDMPFLVDSVRMEITRQGYGVHLLVHPVMKVRRDASGDLTAVLAAGADAADATYESFMHLEVSRETDPARLEALRVGLRGVLADVRAAFEDWRPMVQRMRDTAQAVRDAPPPLPGAELAESLAFLEWLVSDHFLFLGCRDYTLAREGEEDVLRVVPGSGLGILREGGAEVPSVSFSTLPPEVRELARSPELLVLTKSNSRATVHRPAYLDYVGVKRFDGEGNVVGERRFLGLYTSIAYRASALDIPVLRRKVRKVIEAAGMLPGSHLGKALLTILETYPRDELFQIGEDDLFRIALGILHLHERPRTRLFVRRDAYGRFYACLVFAPRDNYSTEVRQRIQRQLMEAFGGTSSEFFVNLSESDLARVLIVVHTPPGSAVEVDYDALEAELARATRRWEDDLADALVGRLGEERGRELHRRYGDAFPAGYREDCSPRVAVHDIELMEALDGDDALALNLYAPLEATGAELRFRLLRRGAAVPLSQSLPLLERLGVRVLEERPYEVEPRDGPCIWVHDMGLEPLAGERVDVERVRELFEEAFLRVWRGDAESDDFNRLVLGAGLTWREIVVLRAYAKYLRQTGFTFSQAYIENTLAANPQIAARLVALFRIRHDPAVGADRSEREQALAAEIEQALDAVASLDEDRILRRLLAATRATVRTNYFQRLPDGAAKPYLALKFDPAKVPGMPEPRPMFEIYVYARRAEGVHLRGGRVARGGLRWSDRMEDFRTEVLGLMKAQMVKNAVIVPVGAKGGFVVKCPPPAGDREALLREVVSCYSMFVRGLLDLTGNRVGGQVAPPPDLVRHDEDDTYLVVAADKGTATFSDIANGIAAEYGFWLGDAFASGGSVGYDHKKMGITARGAWESVKKHFRALGIDIQTTGFTVAGIGDMSGDVFGNGMLLSRHIRLVAAFDHRHIFLDPNPDAETSFRERERLFALPRSSWADYDVGLISKGGGVFARSAKSIRLTPEARACLGVDASALTPQELIQAILRAPVDLLYNGGIGTYVKASDETHADAGDRTNDGVRIDARELRCRVVGEGGNLGFTQRARIEFAAAGGLIHTDAIDNSAGVDCSDHEVNIKILLDAVVADGEMTVKQRNRLLTEMTDEVAQLVLADNYRQAQALGVNRAMGAALLDAQARFMRFLERQGKLNRAIEFLPDEDELAARRAARLGLTSPEAAVVLAYAKIWLYEEVLASDLAEDPMIGVELSAYFPVPLRERFRPVMDRHPLRREIVATVMANEIVNRAGSTFVHRLMEEAGARPAGAARAYVLAREVFRLPELWNDIDRLDHQVDDAVQTAMLMRAGRMLVRASLWFLRHRLTGVDLAATVERFRGPAAELEAALATLLPEPDAGRFREETARYAEAGVPAPLAQRVAAAEYVVSALDIAEVTRATERSVGCVADVYFALWGRLQVAWLRAQAGALAADTHWQTLARASVRDELAEKLRELTAVVLKASPQLTERDALMAVWEEKNAGPLERLRQVVGELQGAASTDLSMLSVVLREMRNLA